MAIFIALVLSVPASAEIIHIPAEAPTIQAGIGAAHDGDTVLVADGTYTGDGNRDIDFLGKAITLRSENGPEYCVIDGYPGYERIFVFDGGEGHESVLEGFTITGGRGEIGEEEWGGGIYCEGSSPTIRGNIITGNTSWYGAGICCWTGSQPIIEGNRISGNQMQYSLETGSFGGGIFIYQCDMVVIRDNEIS
jgi:parallel beta-helix repeat protein